MIKAGELRIGNWVRKYKLQEVDQVVSASPMFYPIHSGDFAAASAAFSAYESKYEYYLLAYDPIPLTAEILEAAGYKEIRNTSHYFYHGNEFESIQKTDAGFWWITAHDDAAHAEPLLCLHQLQNLYFALTGKELEIKFTQPTNVKP
jgi:hypothetical protein